MHVAYVGVQNPCEGGQGQEPPQAAEGIKPQQGSETHAKNSVQQGSRAKLQALCGIIVDAFSDAGLLLSRDDRQVQTFP